MFNPSAQPIEERPPQYVNDLGWGGEFESRKLQIFGEINSEIISDSGVVSIENNIRNLSLLIDEVEERVRKNPKVLNNRPLTEASPFLVELLYMYYNLNKRLENAQSAVQA
jgi:hypothetical protein